MESEIKKIELFEYETYGKDVDFKSIDMKYFSTEWKSNKTYLKATNYVGVAQFNDIRISVYPKIYASATDKNSQKQQAMNNFIFLLSYIHNIDKIKYFDSSSDEMKNYDFLEILIYLFAKNLLDILKHNLNRNYVIVHEDSNFLKGSWRIGEQLSRMPHIKHKFLVSYDEFTENNLLNQILKYACAMLIKFSRNNRNITLLKNIELIFAEVDDIAKPNLANFNQVKFNRLNNEFEFVFELCKMFILNIIGDYSGASKQNFSFMFDMNLLFEQFIANFIRKENLIPANYEMKSQKSENRYLSEEPKAFMLKPDISFWENNECIMIIDTKYKLLDDKDEKKLGISQSDVYQMYAYSQKYECPRVILLYPDHLQNNIEKKYVFEDGKIMEIKTVNISIDLRNNENKKALKNELTEIVLRDYIENQKRRKLLELKGKIEFFEDYDYKAMRREIK